MLRYRWRGRQRCLLTAAVLLAAAPVDGGPCLATIPALPDIPQPVIVVAPAAPPVSTVSLDATQPASILGQSFIRDVLPPTVAYDDIVRITPSVVSIEPNGPGLSENATLTIRGFADGQYDVTFDGIPFADADDFTHHSTAYFDQQSLREVSVDRGPGAASTLGDATFGGSVALRSIDPADHAGMTIDATTGSFDTRRYGGRLDSGRMVGLGGGALVLDIEHTGSDGALAGTGQERTNLFAKAVQPLGADISLTLVATTEWLEQYQPPGATLAEIAAHGADFALGDDPASQNDRAFNRETYRTDFEYAALHAQFGPHLLLDDTVYSYGLYRHFANGEDVNGETPNGTAFGAGDVPGQAARNDLRAVGSVLRLTRSWPAMSVRTGLWIEHQGNQRSQYEVDMTQGGRPNPVLPLVPDVPGSAAIDRLQNDTLCSLQPYLELDWHPLSFLTVTPGIKYALFSRGVDAPVMEGTRLTLQDHVTYGAALPALAVNARLSAYWSAYAQAAKGFLAPQLQFLDVADPASDPVQPEQTWNFQLGTNRHGPGLILSTDVYYIDFSNLVNSRTIGSETMLFNEGGADYIGWENEATIGLGRGLDLYVNASLERARDRAAGTPVPNAPNATLAGGILYRSHGWHAALIDKWVDARYGDTARTAGLPPFNQMDLSLGHDLYLPGSRARPLKLLLTAQNLLDHRSTDALAGYTVADRTPLWFDQAGRSLYLSASLSF